MPHVVLKGPLSAEAIWMAFQPIQVREGTNHYKVTDAYLSHDRETLLLRALIVERGFTKAFFARLVQRADEVTVNLEHLTDPDKSDGVRRLLGLVAWHLLQAEPHEVMVRTNVPECVKAPVA